MNITLDALKSQVKSFEQNKLNKEFTPSNAVFLPNGKHTGRFVIDSTGQSFFEQYNAYGFFNAGIRDPEDLPAEELPEVFTNDLRELYYNYLRHSRAWSRNRQQVFIFYWYLVDTDNPSDNWKPGNLYCVVGKQKVGDAVMGFVQDMISRAPEFAQSMFDPTKETYLLQMNYTAGRDGSCAISAAFPQSQTGAIDMTDRIWTPLQQAYIPPGFDKKKYDKLVEKYVKEIEENAAYIHAERHKASEERRRKDCEEAGKLFTPTSLPEVMVIEANDHIYATLNMSGVNKALNSASTGTEQQTNSPSPAPVENSTPVNNQVSSPTTPTYNDPPFDTTPQPAATQPTAQMTDGTVDPFAQFKKK